MSGSRCIWRRNFVIAWLCYIYSERQCRRDTRSCQGGGHKDTFMRHLCAIQITLLSSFWDPNQLAKIHSVVRKLKRSSLWFCSSRSLLRASKFGITGVALLVHAPMWLGNANLEVPLHSIVKTCTSVEAVTVSATWLYNMRDGGFG